MKFPTEYIKRGEFVLHSGQRSNTLYDVNDMLTNNLYMRQVLDNIPKSEHYVGIATAGAVIASAARVRDNSKFSMIKDGVLKGPKPKRSWTLIDDVVTTGKSLLEAISLVGSEPEHIFVVIDRRERNESPTVWYIFEI